MNTSARKATCLQCHKQMDMIIKEPNLTSCISVCDNPECPNYGLLCISEEMMYKSFNDNK